MNITDYIERCLKEMGFPQYTIREDGSFHFNIISGLVMTPVLITSEERNMTITVIMGYRMPEEKEQKVLEYLKQQCPDDGYDVNLHVSDCWLWGESVCEIQENMNPDFVKNTVLQTVNCLNHHIPNILRIILADEEMV